MAKLLDGDPTGGKATIFIRNMSRTLHDAFKGYCAERGITMRQKIIELMQKTVNQKGLDITAPNTTKTNLRNKELRS